MYCVYILESQDDKSWYIGFTNNLQRRLDEHKDGFGGRTTRLKKSWELIYAEAYIDKKDAAGRERFLKSGSGRNFVKKQLRHYLAIKVD